MHGQSPAGPNETGRKANPPKTKKPERERDSEPRTRTRRERALLVLGNNVHDGASRARPGDNQPPHPPPLNSRGFFIGPQ